jgi:hypothetical protein
VGNNGATYTSIYQGVDYGFNITTPSEMSHMFYTTLGDKAYYTTSGTAQAGYGLTNSGPFSNVQTYDYWSATEYAPNTNNAWVFSTTNGNQFNVPKPAILNAWAVHSGDVGVAVTASTVPLPAATWLFGSGLLGLIGMGRRKAA